MFTNAHAYMQESDFFENLDDLDKVDWQLLRSRDFKRDPEDPGKVGRYQAEALAHQSVPVSALLGIVCFDSDSQAALSSEVQRQGLSIEVKVVPGWYF